MDTTESTPRTTNSYNNLLKAIGPGILVACAAIGGSHLVWSTRAGAEFGWSLLGVILLANLFKLPFFLYGQRYTAATGESLLHGYKRQGIFYLYAFLFVNLLTGTINIAAVAMLTGALLASCKLGISTIHLSCLIILTCLALMYFGRYRLLDRFAKVVVACLSIVTIIAVYFAIKKGSVAPVDFLGPSPWAIASIPFLVSLLGWMPAPIDLSAWSSLWMFSREKQTKHIASVRESAIDFYTSYSVVVIIGVAFLVLGKFVMFGSGESFSESGIGFSIQLVNLYANTIGEWSRWLILSAAFLTMFSTTLTCIDGYPRAITASVQLIRGTPEKLFNSNKLFWMGLTSSAAIIVLLFFIKNLMTMLSFAAIISFLTSPLLAYINLRVMNGENVPEEYKPGWFLKIISYLGLLFFIIMSLSYLILLFIK